MNLLLCVTHLPTGHGHQQDSCFGKCRSGQWGEGGVSRVSPMAEVPSFVHWVLLCRRLGVSLWCPLQATNDWNMAKAVESLLFLRISLLSHTLAFPPGLGGKAGHRKNQVFWDKSQVPRILFILLYGAFLGKYYFMMLSDILSRISVHLTLSQFSQRPQFHRGDCNC